MQNLTIQDMEELCVDDFVSFKEVMKHEFLENFIDMFVLSIKKSHSAKSWLKDLYFFSADPDFKAAIEYFHGLKEATDYSTHRQKLVDYLTHQNIVNNERILYYELSKLMQVRIYIKPLAELKKVRIYEIRDSPLSVYIVDNIDRVYFMEPRVNRHPWENDDKNSKCEFNFCRADLMHLYQRNDKECLNCKKNPSKVWCTDLHGFCEECISTNSRLFCPVCKKLDLMLAFFEFGMKYTPFHNDRVSLCTRCKIHKKTESNLCRLCIRAFEICEEQLP